MTNSIRSRIKQAAKVALSAEDKFKIGCAVYKGSRLLSSGFNQMKKTHRSACDHYAYPFPHAEYNAVRTLCTDSLRNCSLYVARIDNFGNYAMAKPCFRCQKMLKSYGVKTVFYTTENGISKIKL